MQRMHTDGCDDSLVASRDATGTPPKQESPCDCLVASPALVRCASRRKMTATDKQTSAESSTKIPICTVAENNTDQTGRRAFLRYAAGSIAASCVASGYAATVGPMIQDKVEFPPILAATEKPEKTPQFDAPDKRIGFAIVGLGRLAVNQILPAFAKSHHARPVALVSGDRNKALRLARQYGIADQAVYDYRSFDQLADNPAVQVIYIVLPNSMHLEFTVRGARAGKHILCEKPMATSVADCQQMIDACKKADRHLMIGYRSQYEPNDLALLQMVRDQGFGTLREFISGNGQNQGDPEQWRLKKAMAGGGPLPDVGIYCINAARFLSAEEPIEVIGHIFTTPGDIRFREVEESAHFILRFPSGFTATCSCSYSSHDSKFLRLQGATGWAEMDPAYEYTGLKLRTGRLIDGNNVVQEFGIDSGDQFAKELDHMAQCVLTNTRPHTPGEEGMQDMRIIDAIYRSAREGRPVTLAVPSRTREPVPASFD